MKRRVIILFLSYLFSYPFFYPAACDPAYPVIFVYYINKVF